MKNQHTCLLNIILTGFLCFSFSTYGHADMGSSGADFLVDVGQNAYEAGNIPDAVHEWSKALILDPDHAKAKAFLKSVGVKQGLYQGTQTKSSHIIKLSRHIKEYEEKVANLEQQKRDLESKFALLQKERDGLFQENIVKDMEKDLVQEKFVELKRISMFEKDQQSAKIQEMEHTFYLRRQDLEARLALQKEQSLDQGVLPLEAQEDTTTIHMQKELWESVNANYSKALEKMSSYENEIASVSQKYNQLKQEAGQKQMRSDNMYDTMENFLYVRNHAVGALGDELITKEIDLARNRKLLLAHMDEMLGMYEIMNAVTP